MNEQITLFLYLFLFLTLLLTNCTNENQSTKVSDKETLPTSIQDTMEMKSPLNAIDLLFQNKQSYIADKFDYPVGKPNAKGYYNAQKFGENNHLGDDWNAVTGGNSDLGDPIYSIANGYVKFAEDIGGGWGKVIRIVHQTPENEVYESLYAHCDELLIKANNYVERGVQIGTIGTANGIYLAHLHFEIRDNVDLPIGGGYSTFREGYLDPTVFLEAHR